MHLSPDTFVSFIVATLLFLLGYNSAPSSPCAKESAFQGFEQENLQVDFQLEQSHIGGERSLKEMDAAVLLEQGQAAANFQAMLRQAQEFPLDCSRILKLVIPYDGKALEWIASWEIIAKALKVAVSTERQLVMLIENNQYGTFCKFEAHQLYCWFMEMAKRNRCSQVHGEQPDMSMSVLSPLRRGIQESTSDFFNTQYFGSEPMAALTNLSDWPWPKSWLIGEGLSWERTWGAFWIRGHILQYIYTAILPNDKEGDNFIAPSKSGKMVTLVWDRAAQNAIRSRFSRDSNKTHAWDRILTISNHVRRTCMANEAKGTIEEWTFAVASVPSDSETVQDPETLIPVASFEQYGWKVVPSEGGQDTAVRSHSDLLAKVLSSDFLIGTFSSPWYRVAAALHSAQMSSNSMLQTKRHWTLDVEWLESL